MKNKAGFTLIEIMIAVGIIGLLAALGSYAVSKGISNARIKQAKVELEMISAATLQLAWDTGRWPNQAKRPSPGSTEIWDISGDASGLLGNDGSFNNWKGPYYAGTLIDPWGNPYFFDPDYYPVTGGKYVVVGSFGPKKQSTHAYDKDDVFILMQDWAAL